MGCRSSRCDAGVWTSSGLRWWIWNWLSWDSSLWSTSILVQMRGEELEVSSPNHKPQRETFGQNFRHCEMFWCRKTKKEKKTANFCSRLGDFQTFIFFIHLGLIFPFLFIKSNVMFCQCLYYLDIEESRFLIEILPNITIRQFDNMPVKTVNGNRTIQPHAGACD